MNSFVEWRMREREDMSDPDNRSLVQPVVILAGTKIPPIMFNIVESVSVPVTIAELSLLGTFQLPMMATIDAQ